MYVLMYFLFTYLRVNANAIKVTQSNRGVENRPIHSAELMHTYRHIFFLGFMYMIFTKYFSEENVLCILTILFNFVKISKCSSSD